tara:strand:+ start:393 stop:1004 length:612 start_codon:yes stop_codon:yes gene_type:complete
MANLVTLQQYKDFAGLQGVKTDARINTIIPQVTKVVKNYCGSSIIDYYSSDKTEYFDILDDRTSRIMLDESPLVSVSQVQERDDQASSYVTLITENSDSSGKYEYIVDTNTDSIIRTTSTGTKYFSKGHKAVKVVYRAGYSATPEDLKLAVFDLIKYYLKDERKARMQIAGAMVENQVSSSITRNIGFPDHIKRILDFYKVYK